MNMTDNDDEDDTIENYTNQSYSLIPPFINRLSQI